MATDRLAQLEAQKEALEKEIAEERAAVRGSVVDEVRKLILKYEITATELKGVVKARKARAKNSTAAAKKPSDVAPKRRGRPRKAA